MPLIDFGKQNVNVVDLDSDDGSGEDSSKTLELSQKRIAKKSTSVPEIRSAVTRRQVALANNKRNVGHDRFLENFDPDSSVRERRKLTRKVNSVNITRKVIGALYDEYGVHIATGIDLCDCLQRECPGCHFPCPRCESLKCGPECRCNRKFVYDQIEYHGYNVIIKNPFNK